MIAVFLVLTVATWIPLVFFARARVTTTTETRVQLAQDMGNQPKYKTQDATEIFADGRELRLPIPGTIARGKLQEDDHLFRGYRSVINAANSNPTVTFFDTMPPQIPLTPAVLKRGQERFNIYCSVCHGADGYGNGQINVRALERQEPKWVQPANLHSEVVVGRPDGHLFNTITNGIRNMAGYGSQVSVDDRWAIVAYLRALQTSQRMQPSAVPAQQANSLQ
jgi:mono/diheme cytochrome c family protein